MKKALVVDDDSIARWHLMKLLESLGVAPYGAGNTNDAVFQIDMMKGKFDFIILDIMLPQNTGVQYAQVLRCDSRLKDCPIVLISAGVHPDKDKRLKAILNTPHIHYLSKPVNLNLLKKTLKI